MVRALTWLTRFVVGVRVMGLWATMRLFLWDKWHPRATLARVPLPCGPFWYRPTRDRDLVIAHVCRPLYRLHADNIRTIVDAGAHIGDETARFLCFHPFARILAIEADPVNVATLRANYAHEPGVTVLHRALWPTAGQVCIAPGSCAQASHVAEAGMPVDTITPETVLEQCGGMIDLFKLDIEGAEAALFADPRRASAWLRHVRILVMECPDQDAPGTTAQVFEALRQTGHAWRCAIAGECLIWMRTPDVRLTRETYLHKK